MKKLGVSALPLFARFLQAPYMEISSPVYFIVKFEIHVCTIVR